MLAAVAVHASAGFLCLEVLITHMKPHRNIPIKGMQKDVWLRPNILYNRSKIYMYKSKCNKMQ